MDEKISENINFIVKRSKGNFKNTKINNGINIKENKTFKFI